MCIYDKEFVELGKKNAEDVITKQNTAKDSKLIKDLKFDMARFLNLPPVDINLSFEQYFEISGKCHHKQHEMFCVRFASNMACIASIVIEPPTPNIIFGVLTNGEIFVEVNGQQHTPDERFYKVAAMQASQLAHQVRDLEYKIITLEVEAKKLTAHKLTPEMKNFIYSLEECMTSFKGERIRDVFGESMNFEPGF